MDHLMNGIICFECTELIKPLYNNMIKIGDIQQAPINIFGYNLNTDLRCAQCNKRLQSRDLYFNNEDEYYIFRKAAVELIASKISKEIYCCGRCSGYSIFERHIYNVNQGEPTNLIDENRYGTTIYSLLEDKEIPKAMFDSVCLLLSCQECYYGTAKYLYGNSENYYKFDIFDRIYFESEVNEFLTGNIIDFANKFKITIHEYELEDFKKVLYTQPMLALLDETGMKLFKAIKQSMDSGKFDTLSKGKMLFRGRIRYKDEKSFSIHDLWSPPQGRASHGRYNSIGKSVLYCSNQKETLPYELHPTNGQTIDVVTFEVNHEVKLFDMDEAFKDFEGFIATPNSESKILKQEYLLTNFIGFCCEAVGYNGVKYSGVGNTNLEYLNYAFFDHGKLGEILRIGGNIEELRVKVSYKTIPYWEKSIEEMLSSIS